MKRFHNPMTLTMVVLLTLLFIASILLFVFVEAVNIGIFAILAGLTSILSLAKIWSEKRFRKSDREYSQLIGEEFNTAGNVSDAIKKGPKRATLVGITTTIAVIGGFVALCLWKPLIGVPSLIAAGLFLLFGTLYKTRKTTVEKYIASKNLATRTFLSEAHNQILSLDTNIIATMNDRIHMPSYVLVIEEAPSRPTMFDLLELQALIGGRKVCLYPADRRVFEAFAERIRAYKPANSTEIIMPVDDPAAMTLTIDIARYTLTQILHHISH